MPGPHPEFLPAGELIYLDDLHLFVRFRIGAFLGFILYLQADRGGVGYAFGSQDIFFQMYFWRFRMCACFVAKQLFQVCLPERVAFDQCLYPSAIRIAIIVSRTVSLIHTLSAVNCVRMAVRVLLQAVRNSKSRTGNQYFFISCLFYPIGGKFFSRSESLSPLKFPG